MNDREKFMQHPFLKGFSRSQSNKLFQLSEQLSFEADKVFFRKGEPATDFYLIHDGKVLVEVSAASHSVVNIQSIGSGESLGWSWLIPPFQWEFDAKVVEYTTLSKLNAARLLEVFEADHELAHLFLKQMVAILAGRLKATRIQYSEIYKMHYYLRGAR